MSRLRVALQLQGHRCMKTPTPQTRRTMREQLEDWARRHQEALDIADNGTPRDPRDPEYQDVRLHDDPPYTTKEITR
jgi:hypothetical protein